MSDLISGMGAAASGMAAQGARLRIVSENIANADTPGFRRKLIAFEALVRDGDATQAVRPGRVSLDRSELTKVYEPAHPLADAEGYYESSNVSMLIELADAREAQRGYEANLRVFEQARQMLTSLFDLLRR